MGELAAKIRQGWATLAAKTRQGWAPVVVVVRGEFTLRNGLVKLGAMLRRAIFLGVFVWAVGTLAAAPGIRVDGYEVVHVYPHDAKAFTQGLIYIDGHLYESTGLNGKSSLRMVELATGRVLQQHDVPAAYFGEGLTDWGSNLIQLTWQAHKGFVYDRFSFSLVRTFSYEGEGWGITHDATQLIMSDGTAYLRFLDPKTFRETGRVKVTDENGRGVES